MNPPPQLTVELRDSGRTILVPAALTVLEALENEGIPIPSMCRAGICGTCETTALSATDRRSTSAPRPATGPAADRYPRPVRLCITAPGVLTHLVLEL
ncbi:2Fe-2S iron-sulfur cluster binding domain-containing protein [Nocardia sp. NPDC057030]|uniref:2Fe-2S iron-sulfur cluster binding domain-containing protein n=1 Tax=unclassified Nocardia TaxID=2637762 RepID=UPI00363E97BC